MRMLGASQAEAATQAGVGERTLRRWEASYWWAAAQWEARERWLHGGDALAMKGLHQALQDPQEYASASKWWADRRIKELEPPRQRHEVAHTLDEALKEIP
jgi:hypothetical protein